MKVNTQVKVTLKYGEMIGNIVEYNTDKDEFGFVTNQCKVDVNGTIYKVYKEDVQETTPLNKGYSAKIEFIANNDSNRFQTTDNERTLEVWVTVKGKELEKVDNILTDIRDIMENELQIDGFKFDYCPNTDEINGKFESNDGMTIEYNYGDMADIKKDIKEAFKTAKKQLGIR
jgi:hypothetical protein